jgi:transcriptional regulator with XRE-family HTH domain
MSVPREVQTFGAEVRRRREALGWALPELAKRSGLTQNYIGAVELGLRDPSLSTIMKLAKGFDVPLWELLGSEGMSPEALEFVRLFEGALPDVQEAIQQILTFSSSKRRR